MQASRRRPFRSLPIRMSRPLLRSLLTIRMTMMMITTRSMPDRTRLDRPPDLVLRLRHNYPRITSRWAVIQTMTMMIRLRLLPMMSTRIRAIMMNSLAYMDEIDESPKVLYTFLLVIFEYYFIIVLSVFIR